MAALVFPINPLAYGYCLALYAALLLAAQNFKLKAWLIGMGVLTGLIVVGVCCEALKSIAFDLAPAGMAYATGFSAWQLNLLGLGYQLSYLVLPSVAPIVLWANYNQPFMQA